MHCIPTRRVSEESPLALVCRRSSLTLGVSMYNGVWTPVFREPTSRRMSAKKPVSKPSDDATLDPSATMTPPADDATLAPPLGNGDTAHPHDVTLAPPAATPGEATAHTYDATLAPPPNSTGLL